MASLQSLFKVVKNVLGSAFLSELVGELIRAIEHEQDQLRGSEPESHRGSSAALSPFVRAEWLKEQIVLSACDRKP